MSIVTFYRGNPNAPKTTQGAHLGANAIITCNGKILLEKRRDCDIWGLVGGGVKRQETPLQAIVREVHEELGLRIAPACFQKLGVYGEPGRIAAYRDGSIWRMVVVVFGLELEQMPEMQISAESRQLRFFSEEELEDIEIVVTHSDIVEDWFSNRQRGLKHFREIMELAELPEDAKAYLQTSYDGIICDPHRLALLLQAQRGFLSKQPYETTLENLAQNAGIPVYSANLLLMIHCFGALRETYRKKGYPESLFRDTVADLRYKLEECRMAYGVDGNFVIWWYPGFFDCTRFKLGRLQYEPTTVKESVLQTLPEAAIYLNCHIPMDGPLTPDSVEESLKLAYDFYKPKGKMMILCNSWLLYPKQYEMYPEGSNLQKFYQRFTIISQKEMPHNPNAWRVFGTMDTNMENYPRETAFQKNLYAFLQAGNKMGSGLGYFLYAP